MKAPSLSDIRAELKLLPPQRLVELCSMLAKYKKENKELLGYLLFDEADREGYVRELGEEIRAQVAAIDSAQNPYFTRKNLRRIQRWLNRYCRFVGDAGAVAEIRLHFLRALSESQIPFDDHAQLLNIFEQERNRTRQTIENVHEDLRRDYERDLEAIG